MTKLAVDAVLLATAAVAALAGIPNTAPPTPSATSVRARAPWEGASSRTDRKRSAERSPADPSANRRGSFILDLLDSLWRGSARPLLERARAPGAGGKPRCPWESRAAPRSGSWISLPFRRARTPRKARTVGPRECGRRWLAPFADRG